MVRRTVGPGPLIDDLGDILGTVDEGSMEALLDVLPCNILWVDGKGRVLKGHTRCTDIFRQDAEPEEGDDLARVLREDLGDDVLLHVGECLETGEPMRKEYFLREKEMYFDLLTIPRGSTEAILVTTDVTWTRRARDRFLIEGEIGRDVMDAMPVYLVTLGSGGEVRMMNRTMLESLGYGLEDVRGKDYLETFVPEDDREELVGVFSRIREGEHTRNENRVLTREGRERTVMWNGRPIRSEDEGGDHFFGIGLDVTELRRGERELRKVEEGKDMILSTISELVLHQDRDLRIQWANTAAAESLGMGVEDLLGRHCYELWGQSDVPCEDCPVMEAMETGRPEMNEKRTPDGRWWSVKGYPVEDEEGGIIGAIEVTRDITGRKEALHQLEGERELLDRIMETSPAGIVMVNREGRITYANGVAERVLGLERERLSGRSYNDPEWKIKAMDGGDFPDEDLPFERVMRTGEAVHDVMHTIERHDRERALISINAAPIRGADNEIEGIVATVEDVTEEVEAERRLERYVDRLEGVHRIDRAILGAGSVRDVADNILEYLGEKTGCHRVSIMLFDPQTSKGRVFRASDSDGGGVGMDQEVHMEGFGGLDRLLRGEVFHVKDIDDLPDGFGSKEGSILEQVRSGGIRSMMNIPLMIEGKMMGTINLGHREPDGITQEAKEIGREVGDLFAIALKQAEMRDRIREHTIELERKVEERTEELRDKAEELEAFAYTVSHDLRAPLRSMEGFARALLEDYSDELDRTGRDYSKRIVRAAERMDRLIYDLLRYSRIGTGEVRSGPVDLGSIMREVMGRHSAEIEERDAVVEVDEGLPTVIGHGTILEMVLENLLTNSIKFVPGDRRPEVRIRADIGRDRARVFFEDNGIGVPEEYQETVFRVFERLHSREVYPGTGIGLAIVRKGMRRMGGEVGMESREGEGSRFWIELPLAEKENDKGYDDDVDMSGEKDTEGG